MVCFQEKLLWELRKLNYEEEASEAIPQAKSSFMSWSTRRELWSINHAAEWSFYSTDVIGCSQQFVNKYHLALRRGEYWPVAFSSCRGVNIPTMANSSYQHNFIGCIIGKRHTQLTFGLCSSTPLAVAHHQEHELTPRQRVGVPPGLGDSHRQ